MRRILGIKWQDRVTNTEVLKRSKVPSMYCLLKQRRMRWLGHVTRMDDGRIPKDLLYGELVRGYRPQGRPQLRYKDVCKRDLKAMQMDTNSWEVIAAERSVWREKVRSGLKSFEKQLEEQREATRQRRKASHSSDRLPTSFVCARCHRDCRSNIGLVSHSRRCKDNI